MINRLEETLTNIETTINLRLPSFENNPDLVVRLSSYQTLITTTRKYLEDIKLNLKLNNLDEVLRLANLIAASTEMLKDDCIEVFAEVSNKPIEKKNLYNKVLKF